MRDARKRHAAKENTAREKPRVSHPAKTALAIAFWLIAWQALSLAVGNPLLIAGPADVLVTLAHDSVTPAFWSAVGFSFMRIFLGFALAFAGALAAGVIAWKLEPFETLFNPLVTFVKSVPVVCIIVLLLVWTGAANVSSVAVALMVFPPVYFSVLEGLKNADDGMRQMLTVFNMGAFMRLRYYYVPAIMPFIVSAAKVAVGIAWKSGIAAEVIGIPTGSVGAGIYAAKIGLDTAKLFSWTIAIVGASALSEKLFLAALDVLLRQSAAVKPARARPAQAANPQPMAFDDVCFSYGAEEVITGFSYTFEAGMRYCLMGPSGAGKTTILDLACGLVNATRGTLERPQQASRDFQDYRLLSHMSAWANVAVVGSTLGETELSLVKHDLDELLGCDSADLPIDALSGGMKRKVSLMRALAANGAALLLDEPFAGMDDISRTDAIALINRHLRGRTLIVTTHDRDDVGYLACKLVTIAHR